MRKLALSLLLSVAMLVTMTPAAVMADTSGSASAEQGGTDGGTIAEVASQIQDRSDDPFDYTTGALKKAALRRASGRDSNYPASFDLRNVDGQSYVTPVKFQNPFGTCWGFAAIAAAETSILSDPALNRDADDADGDGDRDEPMYSTSPSQIGSSDGCDAEGKQILDLSEKHLVYFVAQAIDDPNNPQNGEGTHVAEGVTVSDRLNHGGLSFMATGLFASGLGPVAEDDGIEPTTLRYMGLHRSIEYRMIDGQVTEYCYDDEDDWSLPEEYRFLQNYSLKESYILPAPAYVDENTGEYTYNPAGTAAIKEMLINKRAVQIGFCADTSLPSQEAGDGVYISKNWAHYTYDASEHPNHAVTIVGWDDNYPKENFVEGHEPEADGAWLVKNSWGSEEEVFPNKGPGWGLENGNGEHTGYFWISYYDRTLDTPEALAFDRNNEIENEGFYVDAHDYMPPLDVEGAAVKGETKMANVFRARECQQLEAVSCQTSYPGTKVVSEIYLLSDDYTDPSDGMLVGTVEGEYEFGGFHKMQMDSPVLIQKGQYYSIIQTQTTPDGQYAVNMPIGLNELFTIATGEDMWEQGVVNKKESYMYADGKWNDYADQKFAKSLFGDSIMMMTYDNFPIKGYCRLQPDISIRVSGSTVLDMCGEDSTVLRISFKGHDAHAVQPEAEWRLSEGGSDIFTLTPDPDDPFKATVKANGVGKANLFVTVPGAGTSVVSLSVKKIDIGGLSVEDSELVYDGKAKKPSVEVTYGDDERLIEPEHYNVEYSNNIKCGRGTIVVTAKKDDPIYQGEGEIGFSILPARAVIRSLSDGDRTLTVKVVDQKPSGIAGYIVNYRVKGTSDWEEKEFSASSNRLVLRNLENGKKYEVKVCAKGPDAEDEYYNLGRFSRVKTSGKIGAPPAKPVIKNIKAGKSKLTITLKGKKPANITKYKVQYRIKGSKKWKTRTVKASGNKIILNKLQKGKRYQIRVSAVKANKIVGKYSKIKTSFEVK